MLVWTVPVNGSTWHNLVGFKNHKKRPSTAHSDFDQNIFCRLKYLWLNVKNNLACSGLVLGLILTCEVQVEHYRNNPQFDQIH